MSKIQAVNYQAQPKLAQPHANHACAQSFGHGLSDLPDGVQKLLTAEVGKRIDKRTGWAGRRFKFLSDSQGEIQNQLINAVFTATLAPLMIAHNPFSKQDEKTKTYTAWRQPISAVIALAVTLPITDKLNKFVDNLYHNGCFETIDLRMAPSKNYLKKVYHKTVEKQGFFTRTWNAIKGVENPNRNKYIEDIQKERLDFFTTLLSEDPDNIQFDEKTKAIMVNGKDLQAGQTIRVPGFETKEALDKYLEKNSFHNKTFGTFLKERFGFEFFPNGELKPNITDFKLSDIKAINFLREMGLVNEKATETDVRKTIAKIYESRKYGESTESFKPSNMKLSSETASKQLEIHGKLTARTVQLYLGEKLGKAEVTTMGQLFHPMGIELEYLNNATKLPLDDTLDAFKEIFNGMGLKGLKENAKTIDFTKNILKNSTKRMTEHAKNYQKYTGIGFNLITTAVGCTILNWAYPRIMERFFPELTKSDKKPDTVKGGNK